MDDSTWRNQEQDIHYRTKVKQLQKRKGKNSIFYI
jgi:hypothetical protein